MSQKVGLLSIQKTGFSGENGHFVLEVGGAVIPIQQLDYYTYCYIHIHERDVALTQCS